MLQIFTLIAAVAAAFSPAQPAVAQSPESTIAIVGADILPMTDRERLTDQTVIVGGDRILAVGPRQSIRVPTGIRQVDAKGLTLMPGLVDMHVHLPAAPGIRGDETEQMLAVMLAHGTTTARGMAGAEVNLQTRDAIERGDIAGPRIYAASPPVNDRAATTTEAARAAVRAAKSSGFDFVKSHHITNPAVWDALQNEAKRLGIPTAGHVTNEVGLQRALDARQQVEHLDGAIAELMRAARPEIHTDYAQFPPAEVAAAAAAADESFFDNLARRVAAAKSYQVPTLALFEKILASTPDDALMHGPESKFTADVTLGNWAKEREQFRQAGITPQQARDLVDVRRRIVRSYARAGVPLMAGSDTPQFFHIAGLGLVQEIKALAAAGLSPMEALKAATITPRNYFRALPNGGSAKGWRTDFGTVEPMARADLILLRGDPSKDLSALDRIETVIARGRLHDRSDLDHMLATSAANAKAMRSAQ